MINIEQLIPIFKPLFLILFLMIIFIIIKSILKNKKKNITSEEKKDKGNKYEIFVAKKYEELGYEVYKKGIIEGLKDGGIDLIATKENETILIQCKNWKIDSKYRIRIKEIREFYGSCNFYIDDNNLDRDKTVCIYIVPDGRLIPTQSKAMFKQYKDKCRYEIIKLELAE